MGIDELIGKSRRLRQHGAYAKALELARRACEADRYATDAWRERAAAAEALGKLDEAAAALFTVGDLLAQATQHGPAHEVMERVLELEPGHRGALRMRSWLGGKMAPPDPDEVVHTEMLARGTLPIPATDVPADDGDSVAEWELAESSHRPQTQNFTRATAVANAAMASPLLLSLRSDALIELSHHAELLDGRADMAIYAEGDTAGAVYFVIDGDITLSRPDAAPLRRGAGELFGGEGLLFDAPRVFAAYKPKDARVLVLGLDDVRTLIATDNHARQAFALAATAEIATAFVHHHGFAADLGGQAAAEFVSRARLVEVVSGDTIIEAGERPNGLVYVAHGSAYLGAEGLKYGPGEPIGARWVLSGKTATAPVKAGEDCWLLAIDRASAAAMIAAHPLLLEKLSQ